MNNTHIHALPGFRCANLLVQSVQGEQMAAAQSSCARAQDILTPATLPR